MRVRIRFTPEHRAQPDEIVTAIPAERSRSAVLPALLYL